MSIAETQELDFSHLAKRIAQKHRAGKRDYGAEPEGIIKRPSDFDNSYHASIVILCKDIAGILTKQWPKYQWAIKPNQKGRVIDIYNLHCHNSYGFTIRIAEIIDDPRRKLAYRAGREILARFNMPERFSPAAIATAPRDINHNMIPDISDILSKKERDNAEVALKLATGEWEIVYTPEGPFLRKNR